VDHLDVPAGADQHVLRILVGHLVRDQAVAARDDEFVGRRRDGRVPDRRLEAVSVHGLDDVTTRDHVPAARGQEPEVRGVGSAMGRAQPDDVVDQRGGVQLLDAPPGIEPAHGVT
jgi:hypothetical protein